jgi:hypothetical protein
VSAIVGALRAILSLESAAFTSGLKQAQKGLTNFSASARKLGGQMQKVGAVASIAGAAIVAGLKGAIDSADALDELSQKIGVPVEQLSALQYAFEKSGVSSETMAAGVGKLSKAMAAAADGNKASAKMFADLGIKVTDATGALRPAADVMADVAGIFADMPDGAEKTALAMQLFGKSGAEMIPALNEGKAGLAGLMDEARKLGIVIDSETAASAGKFNDNLFTLGAAASGLAVQIAADLLPTLQKISDFLVDMAKAYADLSPGMQEFIANVAGAIVVGGPLLVGLGLMVSAVGHVGAAFSALAALIMANPLAAAVALIAGGAYLIWYNWDWLKQQFSEIWQSIKDKAVAAWDYIKTTIADAIAFVQAKWEIFVAKIEAAIQTAKDAAKAIGDALSIGREEMNSGEGYGGMGGAMDGNPAVVDPMSYERGKATGRAIGDGMADGLQEAMLQHDSTMRAAFFAPVKTARDVLGIASPSKVFKEIGEFLTQGLAIGIKEGQPEVETAMEDVAKTAAEKTAEAADTLRDTGRGLFREWITGARTAGDALAGLADRLADMLAESAFDGLFGSSGIFGGIFDSLAGVFGFANGGVFSGGRVTAFAAGGVVSGPTPFPMRGGLGLMGEAGPEAIMPLTRGPGGKLGVQAIGGGGSVVRLVVEENPMFAARVRTEAQGVAVDVVRQYDAEVAPASRARPPREVG